MSVENDFHQNFSYNCLCYNGVLCVCVFLGSVGRSGHRESS